MALVAWILGAFLLGSIPFGLLIARTRGVDIRAHGSGNIGATNVARVLGLRLGLACFALDVLKGLVPTLAFGLSHGLLGRYDLEPGQAWAWLGVFAAPVLGHMFSPFARLRGGKGVATSLGSLLGVFPALALPAIGALMVWIVVFGRWRMVGIASCAAALALPVLTAVSFALDGHTRAGVPMLIVTGLLALIVLIKHRGNIARTLAGTEPRFGEAAQAREDGGRQERAGR